MYLRTHCNIGSKRPCCPIASDVEPSYVISTVHLWHRAVPLDVRGLTLWLLIAVDYSCTKGYLPALQQAFLTAIYAYSYTIRSAQLVKLAKFGLFRGLIAPKLYVPHQNSRTKGISLGCRLAHEMIFIAHNCAVWAAALWQTPCPTLEYCILGCLGTWKTPCAEILNFFTVYACENQFMSVVSKAQYKWLKGCIALITKKHVLARWGRTPGAISPIFLVWVRTVAPHLHSRFYPDRFRFGEVLTKKTCPWGPK